MTKILILIALYAPHAVIFCPLHKTSLGNTYLKMFYLAKLFVADAPGKKIVFLPLKAVWNMGLKIAHAWEGYIIHLGFVVSFSASAVTRVAEVVTVVVAVDPGGSGVLCNISNLVTVVMAVDPGGSGVLWSNIALTYRHVTFPLLYVEHLTI